MTLYLLDTNVLRELRPGGHLNVLSWSKTVDDLGFRISVITLHETRRGWEVKRRLDPVRAADGLAKVALLERIYRDRIIPVDAPIAAEWARLLGEACLARKTSIAMTWRSPRRAGF